MRRLGAILLVFLSGCGAPEESNVPAVRGAVRAVLKTRNSPWTGESTLYADGTVIRKICNVDTGTCDYPSGENIWEAARMRKLELGIERARGAALESVHVTGCAGAYDSILLTADGGRVPLYERKPGCIERANPNSVELILMLLSL